MHRVSGPALTQRRVASAARLFCSSAQRAEIHGRFCDVLSRIANQYDVGTARIEYGPIETCDYNSARQRRAVLRPRTACEIRIWQRSGQSRSESRRAADGPWLDRHAAGRWKQAHLEIRHSHIVVEGMERQFGDDVDAGWIIAEHCERFALPVQTFARPRVKFSVERDAPERRYHLDVIDGRLHDVDMVGCVKPRSHVVDTALSQLDRLGKAARIERDFEGTHTDGEDRQYGGKDDVRA